MKRTIRKPLLLVAAAIIAVIGTKIAWDLYWHVPGKLDFLIRKRSLELIVAEIRTAPVTTDKSRNRRDVRGIPVVFKKDSSGNLSITIVTADWGHLGKAGYLYSDKPPVRIENDAYRNVDAPGDTWMLEKQVAPNWWVISNHLY